MNVNKMIKKLLYALQQKGELYKINSFQFYSEKTNKYCTKYQIMKKVPFEVWNKETHSFETKYKYKTQKECYGKVDVMKYLVDENRKGSEADG